jgi:2-polyprenyl-6-methoxyphenol hydroxylase-like FAD-dependent oxidoreductase
MRYGAPYWVALRRDLHEALLETAEAEPLIALTMGFGVAEVAVEEDMVAVATDTGHAWTGRALIAADGVWSLIRTRQFDSAPPRFAGKAAARSVLPLDVLGPEFQKPETGIWLFADAHVVHYPVAAGNALAVVVIVADEHDDEDWNTPVAPAWVHHRLPTCATPLRSLIATARTWKRWALHTLPVVPFWSRGPLALLGDAAHPVLPFLAQGGVMALEDAAVVAEALERFAQDVPAALRWYAGQRRPRVMRVAQASRRNGRIYHLSGPFAAARNLVLSKTGPDRLMSRYDWLYGWRPQ